MVNRRVRNAVLGCNLKNNRMISVHFKGKPFNITVIQDYAPTSNAEEAEVERFYEGLQDLLELTPKRCSFHYSGLECKSRKSRDTWNNRKISPWSTEWSRANADKSFAEKTHWSQQTPSSNNIREDSTQGHHQMVNTKIRLIVFFAAKDGEALYSQQKQNWELTVAQMMNSLLPNSDLNWRK